ncbi:hypothetical protein ACFQ51_52160 [Streptomyces kaempferi]
MFPIIGKIGPDFDAASSIDLTPDIANLLTGAIYQLDALNRQTSEQTLTEEIPSGEWSAAAVAQNDPDLYAKVTELFTDQFAGPTLIALTNDVLMDRQTDSLSVNQALDSWFGDVPAPDALGDLIDPAADGDEL